MINRPGSVRNPLTIIGAFAGLAEVGGTAVLPFIAPSSQWAYVWFLILFPFTLVVLFFATLNFNRGALYAPSDFEDESNFFRSLREGMADDRARKVRMEVQEIQLEVHGGTGANGIMQSATDTGGRQNAWSDAATKYFVAEELALHKFSQMLGDEPIMRNVEVAGIPYLFDAAVRGITGPSSVSGIEVVYLADIAGLDARVQETVDRVAGAFSLAPAPDQTPFGLGVLVVAETSSNEDRRTAFDATRQTNAPFAVEVFVFQLAQLQVEWESGSWALTSASSRRRSQSC